MATDSEASCESDPNFAVICGFLEKFGVTCGLTNIDFLDLQEMLENTQEVPQELIDLHVKLLRKARKSVSSERWERAIIKLCHGFCSQDAWEIERFGYKKARISSKLRILKELLEMQFDFNIKFKSEVNKLSADELRAQPLGRDRLGHAYWFQTDDSCQIRVYKEDPDEETWALVAKDRGGLVSLIGHLTTGDSVAIGTEDMVNEDSNSLESDKPIVDTGQTDSNSSQDNGEINGNCKNVGEQSPKDGVTESVNNTEQDVENKKVDRKEKMLIENEDFPKKNGQDCEEEKSDGNNQSNDDYKGDTETEDAIVSAENVDSNSSASSQPSVESKPVPQLRIKPITELIAAPQKSEAYKKPELTGVKGKYIRMDSTGDSNKVVHRKAVDSAGFDTTDMSVNDFKRPLDEDINITELSLMKRPRLDRPKLLGNRKLRKSYSDEEVEDEIEEPVMLVKGDGAGQDNEALFERSDGDNENSFRIQSPIVGEVVEEPIQYYYGEGSGHDCATGNDNNAPNTKENKSETNQNLTEKDNLDTVKNCKRDLNSASESNTLGEIPHETMKADTSNSIKDSKPSFIEPCPAENVTIRKSASKHEYKLGTIIDVKTNKVSPTKSPIKRSRWDVRKPGSLDNELTQTSEHKNETVSEHHFNETKPTSAEEIVGDDTLVCVDKKSSDEQVNDCSLPKVSTLVLENIPSKVDKNKTIDDSKRKVTEDGGLADKLGIEVTKNDEKSDGVIENPATAKKVPDSTNEVAEDVGKQVLQEETKAATQPLFFFGPGCLQVKPSVNIGLTTFGARKEVECDFQNKIGTVMKSPKSSENESKENRDTSQAPIIEIKSTSVDEIITKPIEVMESVLEHAQLSETKMNLDNKATPSTGLHEICDNDHSNLQENVISNKSDSHQCSSETKEQHISKENIETANNCVDFDIVSGDKNSANKYTKNSPVNSEIVAHPVPEVKDLRNSSQFDLNSLKVDEKSPCLFSVTKDVSSDLVSGTNETKNKLSDASSASQSVAVEDSQVGDNSKEPVFEIPSSKHPSKDKTGSSRVSNDGEEKRVTETIEGNRGGQHLHPEKSEVKSGKTEKVVDYESSVHQQHLPAEENTSGNIQQQVDSSVSGSTEESTSQKVENQLNKNSKESNAQKEVKNKDDRTKISEPKVSKKIPILVEQSGNLKGATYDESIQPSKSPVDSPVSGSTEESTSQTVENQLNKNVKESNVQKEVKNKDDRTKISEPKVSKKIPKLVEQSGNLKGATDHDESIQPSKSPVDSPVSGRTEESTSQKVENQLNKNSKESNVQKEVTNKDDHTKISEPKVSKKIPKLLEQSGNLKGATDHDESIQPSKSPVAEGFTQKQEGEIKKNVTKSLVNKDETTVKQSKYFDQSTDIKNLPQLVLTKNDSKSNVKESKSEAQELLASVSKEPTSETANVLTPHHLSSTVSRKTGDCTQIETNLNVVDDNMQITSTSSAGKDNEIVAKNKSEIVVNEAVDLSKQTSARSSIDNEAVSQISAAHEKTVLAGVKKGDGGSCIKTKGSASINKEESNKLEEEMPVSKDNTTTQPHKVKEELKKQKTDNIVSDGQKVTSELRKNKSKESSAKVNEKLEANKILEADVKASSISKVVNRKIETTTNTAQIVLKTEESDIKQHKNKKSTINLLTENISSNITKDRPIIDVEQKSGALLENVSKKVQEAEKSSVVIATGEIDNKVTSDVAHNDVLQDKAASSVEKTHNMAETIAINTAKKKDTVFQSKQQINEPVGTGGVRKEAVLEVCSISVSKTDLNTTTQAISCDENKKILNDIPSGIKQSSVVMDNIGLHTEVSNVSDISSPVLQKVSDVSVVEEIPLSTEDDSKFKVHEVVTEKFGEQKKGQIVHAPDSNILTTKVEPPRTESETKVESKSLSVEENKDDVKNVEKVEDVEAKNVRKINQKNKSKVGVISDEKSIKSKDESLNEKSKSVEKESVILEDVKPNVLNKSDGQIKSDENIKDERKQQNDETVEATKEISTNSVEHKESNVNTRRLRSKQVPNKDMPEKKSAKTVKGEATANKKQKLTGKVEKLNNKQDLKSIKKKVKNTDQQDATPLRKLRSADKHVINKPISTEDLKEIEEQVVDVIETVEQKPAKAKQKKNIKNAKAKVNVEDVTKPVEGNLKVKPVVEPKCVQKKVPLLTCIDINKLKEKPDSENEKEADEIRTSGKDVREPEIEGVAAIVSDDSSDGVADVPEYDPLAYSDDDIDMGADTTDVGMTINTFKLDISESPSPPPRRLTRNRPSCPDVVPIVIKESRKRGRISTENEKDTQEVVGKRPKLKGKRSVADKNLRRSIEQQKNLEVSSSDDDSRITKISESKKTIKKLGKKDPVSKKAKKSVEHVKKKASLRATRTTDSPALSSDVPSEDSRTNIISTASVKKHSDRKQKKKTLMGLDILPETEMLQNSEPTVRQSRRIAQIKIKEEADRRKFEEMTIIELKEQKKRKGKKEEDKDYKADKKKKHIHIPTEDETTVEVESDEKKKRKRKRKHKDPRKIFDESNPWKSSSGSSSSEADDDEEEIEAEPSEDEAHLFRSDHEFSPESDLEEESEMRPLKRARTVRKESDVEEEYDDRACQKCGQTDHPEWILLCDKCDCGWHCSCLRPALLVIPEGDWFCPPCQHVSLLANLDERLADFDKKVVKRDMEVRRQQRLAYVGISLDNVLPSKEADDGLNKQKHARRERERESESDESESESDSESSSSSNDSDEPIYQLRERRQAHSYRFNDYDDLINSAIQDEVEAVKGAGNQGRGKDIATIVNAEKEEAALRMQSEDKIEGTSKEVEPLPPVVPPEKIEKDEDSDDEPIRPSRKLIGKKKHRKLNCLDVDSEDDADSDEDFKGSSSSESEDDFEDDDSDSSRGRRKRRKDFEPVRRSTRARISRYDREFIDDNSDSDDAPKKKKTRSIWDNSESEESDRSWGRRKRRNERSRRQPPSRPKKSKKKKRSRKNADDSDPEVYRRKPNIKFGGLNDDEEVGPRTRGKKINYLEALGSDSDEIAPRKPPRIIDSEEEYVVNDEDVLRADLENESEDNEFDLEGASAVDVRPSPVASLTSSDLVSSSMPLPQTTAASVTTTVPDSVATPVLDAHLTVNSFNGSGRDPVTELLSSTGFPGTIHDPPPYSLANDGVLSAPVTRPPLGSVLSNLNAPVMVSSTLGPSIAVHNPSCDTSVDGPTFGPVSSSIDPSGSMFTQMPSAAPMFDLQQKSPRGRGRGRGTAGIQKPRNSREGPVSMAHPFAYEQESPDFDDELNPIEQINRNMELMSETETAKMMEEEDYANRQLQLVALQIEKEKKRKERESQTQSEPKVPKKRGRKPKNQLGPLQSATVAPPSSLLMSSDVQNNAELSEPPGVTLPMFSELSSMTMNVDGTPKKRRGRGKGKKTLAAQQVDAEGMPTSNMTTISDSPLLSSKLGIATPPQPFSQSQPSPSVITRMLQSQPGHRNFPVNSGAKFYGGPPNESHIPHSTSPVSLSQPPSGTPNQYLPVTTGSRLPIPGPYQQPPSGIGGHYPVLRSGAPPPLRMHGPAQQNMPPMFAHRAMDPSPSGGGPINISASNSDRNSPAAVPPASGSPLNKNEPSQPPPPYPRGQYPPGSANNTSTMPSSGPGAQPPRTSSMLPAHLQQHRASGYHSGVPPSNYYGSYGPHLGTEEGQYQNAPYNEAFCGEGTQPPHPSDNSNSKPFDEETGGEFGGLVSYFSSQREDDLDT